MASKLQAKSSQSSGAVSRSQTGKDVFENGEPATTAQQDASILGTASHTNSSDLSDQTTAAPADNCDAHASVGLSSISVSTANDRDGYPRLNVIVDLPDGSKEPFRARLDTGCDLNLMTEEVAGRLTDVDSLPDSDLEEPIGSLSTTPVWPVKCMKLTFTISGVFIEPGVLKPFKTWFYVVPDDSVHEAFDALLGEGFIVAKNLLEIVKHLNAASNSGASTA